MSRLSFSRAPPAPIVPPPARFEDGLVEVQLVLMPWSCETGCRAWELFVRERELVG